MTARPSHPPLADASGARPRGLGVQLYTVREAFPHDFVGVLEAVKRAGYDEVEFAGYHGRAPREVRAVLDGVGLTAPAAHVGLDALRGDLAAHLTAAAVLGHRYLVVPGLPEPLRGSLDGYRQAAEALGEVGALALEAGVRLAYHNHAEEFETFGGDRSGYDVLLDETDPALVAMEMDLFWTVHAGRDPVDYFSRHPGRFPLFHVKDRTGVGEMTEVGSGEIDFAWAFAHAGQAGLEHAFVEHDEPADGLESVRASYGPLAALRWS